MTFRMLHARTSRGDPLRCLTLKGRKMNYDQQSGVGPSASCVGNSSCTNAFVVCGDLQDKEGSWVVEWDYESLLSLHSADINMRVTRVGFVRYADGVEPCEEEALTKALQPFSCVPVFLSKALAKKFYHDFCKVILRRNSRHGRVVNKGGSEGLRGVRRHCTELMP